MGRFGNFALGLVFGALVGSAVALLLTPESGPQIRTQLEDYANDLQREVREAAMKRRLELELELARLRSGTPRRDIQIQ